MKSTVMPVSRIYPLLIAVLLAAVTDSYGKNVKNAGSTVMIFAAASLADVLGELSATFEKRFSVRTKSNLASSGTLARQMAQGATPDVFVSANRRWMNYVDSLGLMSKDLITPAAENDLVLIAPLGSRYGRMVIDSSLDIPALLAHGRLSLGDPQHVPAGKYAQEALVCFGWYAALKPHLLPAKDVRSALMIVEMGEAPLGIVYRTDAEKSEKVTIIGTFPEKSHKPIVYSAGVCRNSRNGRLFYDFITSEDAKNIWTKYGFKKSTAGSQH